MQRREIFIVDVWADVHIKKRKLRLERVPPNLVIAVYNDAGLLQAALQDWYVPLLFFIYFIFKWRCQYAGMKAVETTMQQKRIPPERKFTHQLKHFGSHFQTEGTSGAQLAAYHLPG